MPFVSVPSLRLYDDYLVIATFGFQIIMYTVLNNLVTITGGPLGIPGIPQPNILGWEVRWQPAFVVLAGIVAVIALAVVSWITASPFGRVLHVIREDEVLARSLGKNVLRFKVTVFAISAALAASAGSVYAQYITYIDPTNYTAMESIFILSMVILGGAGSRWGPVVGAVLLVTLPELLRFTGLPNAVAGNVRQILFGAAMVACMAWRPQGLMGRFTFER